MTNKDKMTKQPADTAKADAVALDDKDLDAARGGLAIKRSKLGSSVVDHKADDVVDHKADDFFDGAGGVADLKKR